MSSPTGTSEPEAGRAAPPGRRRTTAVMLWLLLALFIGAGAFRTTDSTGAVRMRSAAAVWSTVGPRLSRTSDARHFVPLYAVALAGSVGGFFLLLWLATGVRSEKVDARRRRANVHPWWLQIVREHPDSRRVALLSTAVTVVLMLVVAWQLGAFAPLAKFGVPDTFASVDHPFHIARAQTLLRSLLEGENLRWVANHQGGYPAEFYPFGFAWMTVGLWAATFGQVALPVVHKFAVIALFVAPAFIFRAMGRRDGWPPVVGLSASVLHLAVPGGMWHGGYTELVYMGLVANVSAAVAVLAAMVCAAEAFTSERRRSLVAAGVFGALAIWCNPRSGLALVVCIGAAWLIATASSGRRVRTSLVQLGAITFIALLLSAPEWLSLVRYQSLYFFVRMTAYGSPLDYLAESIDAVSLPGALLAVAGVAGGWVAGPRRYVTRTVVAALAGYVLFTVFFAFGASRLVEQLEATRLMPVQRLLTVYLAAVGLHAVAVFIGARRPGFPWIPYAVQATAIAAVLVVFLGPARLLPFWSRGLFEVQRSTTPEMGILQSVLVQATGARPPGTAILVVGSAVSTHQQLWAPVRSDELFFYDSWMWFWQTRHRGPYDPRSMTKYYSARVDELFGRDYLDLHGIGAIVAISDVQDSANASAAVRRVFGGDYGLYAVNDPVPAITFAGVVPDALTITNHRIMADGSSPGGEAFVRRNWFPRWRATVNGRPVPITQTDEGYIRVRIPAGRVRLEMEYALGPWDVAGRAAMAAGVLLALLLLAGWRRPTLPSGSRAGMVAGTGANPRPY